MGEARTHREKGAADVIERLAVLLVALMLGLGVAACGGDDGTATDTTTTEETTTDGDAFAAGRTVFVAECGVCHTLSEAGTSGTTGPVLDGTTLSVDGVETQVRNGGGVMPAFEGNLTDEEIENVAAYVVEAAGG
jgi:mono/diheme cytochrome c family protein